MSQSGSDPAGQTPPAERRAIRTPPIVALMAVSSLNAFAVNVVVPIMPALQDVFQTDYAKVQLVLSVYLAMMAVSQMIIGPFSDRYGRRPVLLVGFSIFAGSAVVAALASTIETVIAMRAIQGGSACVGLVLGRAIVRDLYDRRQAASKLGYVTMGLAVAPMVAPLIGGVLQETFGWQAVFWALSLAAIGLIAVTYVKVPETNLARTSSLSFGTMIRDFGKLIREPDFLGFTLCSSLSMGAFFSYIGGVPYVSAFVMGMTPIEYGLWFASMAFGYSAGSFLSGRYAERLGVARMILFGTALAVVGVGLAILFALLGIKSPPALFLPMSLMGVANGLSLPSAISGAISVRPEIAGAASGLSGTAQISTGAILSTISGAVLVGATTALPMLWLIFAASAGSFLVALQIFLRGR